MLNITGAPHGLTNLAPAQECTPKRGPEATPAAGFFDMLKGQVTREEAPQQREPDRPPSGVDMKPDDKETPVKSRQAEGVREEEKKAPAEAGGDEGGREKIRAETKEKNDRGTGDKAAALSKDEEKKAVPPDHGAPHPLRPRGAKEKTKNGGEKESSERQSNEGIDPFRHLLDIFRKEQHAPRDAEKIQASAAELLHGANRAPDRRGTQARGEALAGKRDGKSEAGRPGAPEMKEDSSAGINTRGQKKETRPLAGEQKVQAGPESPLKRQEFTVDGARTEAGKAFQPAERGPQGLDFAAQLSKNELSSHRQSVRDSGPRNAAFMETLNEIVNGARVTVRDERNGTFTVKLYPPELGSVNVNIGLENGTVSGRFLVNSDEARLLLMENLEFVKKELSDAGLTVGEFRVDVSGDGRRFFEEREPGRENHVILPAINAEDMKDDYVAHATKAHDGLIDMVI